MSACTNRSIPSKAILEEIEDLQQRTAAAAFRCQIQLNEAELIGDGTLQVLRQQRDTILSINESTEALNDKVDHSNKLLNRYDVWAGHWFGRNKRIARKEAKQGMKEMKLASIGNTKISVSSDPAESFATGEESMRSQLFMSKSSNGLPKKTRQPEDLPVELPLDEETRMDLKQIESRDAELDQVLDSMTESLDRLANISKLMNGEAVQSKQSIEKVATKLDHVHQKQFVAQKRLRQNVNK